MPRKVTMDHQLQVRPTSESMAPVVWSWPQETFNNTESFSLQKNVEITLFDDGAD